MKRYFPQLDGLRALAALSILVHHYWPVSVHYDLSKGRLGVDFFFVLSGYLITRSLMRGRETAPRKPLVALKAFYKRRVLRIVPLYYLTLLLACLLPYERSASLGWHAAFLSNIYFVAKQRFVGAGGHLWALAIEQQFYLLWPLAVLFVPRRHVRAAALAMVGAGLCFRMAAWAGEWSDLTAGIMTWTAFESLGCGALLAGWMASREERPARWSGWIGAAGLIGVILWLPHMALSSESAAGYAYALLTNELSRALLSSWLIAQAVWGIPGWFGRLFASAPARGLGLWSYGIYLSHNFILGLCRFTPHHIGSLSMYNSQAVLALGLTLAWSAACYFLIEAPLAKFSSARQSISRTVVHRGEANRWPVAG